MSWRALPRTTRDNRAKPSVSPFLGTPFYDVSVIFVLPKATASGIHESSGGRTFLPRVPHPTSLASAAGRFCSPPTLAFQRRARTVLT